MPTGTRLVLQANIGQNALTPRLLPSPGSVVTFATETDLDGCNVFAEKGYFSGNVSSPILTSFGPNTQLFLRRVRIASDLQGYGAKLLQRGSWGIPSLTGKPVRRANTSFLQIWGNQLSNLSPLGKIWESDSIPLLNEWMDVNLLIYPSGGGVQNLSTFLSCVYSLDVDFTDLPARLLGGNSDLRIEIEVDYPNGALNTPPNIAPTVPSNRGVWAVNQDVVSSALAANTTFRTKYVNKTGKSLSYVRFGFPFQGAGGFSPVVLAFLGRGPFSGSLNLDCTSYAPILFNSGASATYTASHPSPDLGYLYSDLLYLPTPLGINESFVLSMVRAPGSFTRSNIGIATTPVSGWVETELAVLPGVFGNVNGQTFSGSFGSLMSFFTGNF